jgi:siroheme synthase-like protein
VINLDDLKPDGLRDLNVSQILSARRIAEEYLERFERWHLARSAAGAPPRFPIFIDLSGRDVVVVGGGRIAARRVNALLPFGARITVVAPRLAPGLHPLAERGDISWISREYLKSDLAGAAMAVAVTSSREVNRQVGEDARALGVPVSVADRRDECTFWFPAVVRSGDLVAGLVSAGGDHALVKRAAQMLRDGEVLKDAQNSDWQP